MKRIALFLAAAAATLASCVKENTLAPEQTSDNLVTIKALATKTTLDGNAVVWEQDDEIAVVLEGVENAVNFGTDGEVNGASAKFVGEIDPVLEYNSAYAVYPATAYKVEAGVAKITHFLPETQTGVVTSGMILSSALLDAEQLKAGNATASFHNALALVKVIVPAGVQSVSLTSSNETLTGAAEFYAPSPSLGRKSLQSGSKTVTLSKGGLEPLPSENDLLVYPANASTLNVRIVGMDGTEYEKNVPTIVFEASKYRTLDLTNLFYMDVEADSEVPVSSMGGTFEVNVVAVDDNTYNVAIESGNPWIQHVQTKAFNGKTIEFNVNPNTSTSSREADITITWTGGSRTFTVVQEGKPELSFVYVDGDPNKELIQWEETFGVYADESLNNKVADFKNTFTIDLSDDPSKGTYKISNLFTNNIAGGTYYADFNSENNELTVYTSESASPSRTYYFDNTVILLYNSSTKTFSSKLTAFTANTMFSFTGYQSKTAFIGNYTAEVKVEEGDGDSIMGNYVENFNTSSAYTTPVGGNLTLAPSDDPEKGNVLITSFLGQNALKIYGELTTQISVAGDPGNYSVFLGNIGPCPAFTITIKDGVATFNESAITYPTISNYAAIKQ